MLALIAPGNYIGSFEGATLVDIPTAGTAVQLTTTDTPCEGIYISALLTNTGVVYYGGSDVDAPTKKGMPLQPGEKDFMPTKNVSVVYVDSTVSGDDICYIPLR